MITTFYPAEYFLPAPSTKLFVVVNSSVMLYTFPSLSEVNAGRSINAIDPAGLYTDDIADLIWLSVSVFV